MKNDEELISVVIPCYNSGRTIAQTIASVKVQTWPRVEIIVVNDGSDDSFTLHVLENLEGVKTIHQENKGLPEARNAGINNSTGTYILPLDADDWIEPDFLEKIYKFLEEHSDAAYVYCDLALEGDADGILTKRFNFLEQLFLNQIPYCIFGKKDLWMLSGGYDKSMNRGYEDWEFNVRLGSRGHYGRCLNAPMFHYRVSSTGMLLSKSNKIHVKLWSEIQNRHPSLYTYGNVLKLWLRWHKVPSRYPASLYLFWYFTTSILPESIVSVLYKCARTAANKLKHKKSKASN